VKSEPEVRILIALELGESKRETARLLGALFTPDSPRASASRGEGPDPALLCSRGSPAGIAAARAARLGTKDVAGPGPADRIVSGKAVEWALLLAALAKARVRLLHILPETSSKWAPSLRRTAIEMVGDHRRAQRRLFEFRSPAVPVEGVVAESRDPARGIREAQRGGVDFVALGALSRTGLSSVFGSVTRRVARDCRCPVLIVPATSHFSRRQVFRRSVARGRPG